MIIHTASPGETIRDIALYYGTDAAELSGINGTAPDEPLPGGTAVLVLFPETRYTVKAGDTLISIAQRYGTSVNAILRNDPRLSASAPLVPGTSIVISFTTEKQGAISSYAYAYPFISDELLESVLPFLSAVTPFTYGFRPDGTLIVPDDGWMIRKADAFGIAPMMHVSTLTEYDTFDSRLAALVLSDAALRDRLTDNIIAELREKGYRALDIDFEYIPAEYAYAYYSFISSLSRKLGPLGHDVFTALAPKVSGAQQGLLYEAHDYPLIGSAADNVLLMTYEWGYSAGPPMAVSPINKVREVLEYAVSVIPREKIYLGISLYGYDWTLPYFPGNPPARSIAPEEAVRLARIKGADIQYSSYAEAPFFYYYENGAAHEVWFEDARSIRARLKLINEYGIRGAGFWHAGRRASQCWQVMNAEYDIIPFG